MPAARPTIQYTMTSDDVTVVKREDLTSEESEGVTEECEGADEEVEDGDEKEDAKDDHAR